MMIACNFPFILIYLEGVFFFFFLFISFFSFFNFWIFFSFFSFFLFSLSSYAPLKIFDLLINFFFCFLSLDLHHSAREDRSTASTDHYAKSGHHIGGLSELLQFIFSFFWASTYLKDCTQYWWMAFQLTPVGTTIYQANPREFGRTGYTYSIVVNLD